MKYHFVMGFDFELCWRYFKGFYFIVLGMVVVAESCFLMSRRQGVRHYSFCCCCCCLSLLLDVVALALMPSVIPLGLLA